MVAQIFKDVNHSAFPRLMKSLQKEAQGVRVGVQPLLPTGLSEEENLADLSRTAGYKINYDRTTQDAGVQEGDTVLSLMRSRLVLTAVDPNQTDNVRLVAAFLAQDYPSPRSNHPT